MHTLRHFTLAAFVLFTSACLAQSAPCDQPLDAALHSGALLAINSRAAGIEIVTTDAATEKETIHVTCKADDPDSAAQTHRVIDRVRDLATVPAKVRFLSCEPLVGPLSRLPLTNIHWVIVGGESGPGARYMNPEWVDSIHQQCIRSGTAFFFKQWGGVRKHKYGRMLNGRTYDEMPLISITQPNNGSQGYTLR